MNLQSNIEDVEGWFSHVIIVTTFVGLALVMLAIFVYWRMGLISF
jgi:hypothetical protein